MSTKTVKAAALKVRSLQGDDGGGAGHIVGHVADAGRGVYTGAQITTTIEKIAEGGLEFDGARPVCGKGASDEVVRKLRDKLERYRRHRARRAGWVRRFVPTGLRPLDERLPHGGLPRGAIIEVYADFAGVGSMTLALRLVVGSDEAIPISSGQAPRRNDEDRRRVGSAARTTAEGSKDEGIEGSRGKVETSKRRSVEMARGGGELCGPIVVVDTHGDFYPPAVVPLGIDLDRLIVLRVRNDKDALWAAEQSLRCPAVAAVIAPLERIDERDSRRLQLAAETSGCVGVVLRPMHRRGRSFAAVQMLVEGGDEATKRRSDGGKGSRGSDEAIPMASGRRSDAGRNVETSKRRNGGTRGAMFPRSGSMPMHRGVGSAVRTSSHLSADSGPATWADSHVDPSVSSDSVVFEEGALRLRDGYRCRITLLAVREGMPTSPCWVDLYHETGTCDVHPLPVDRPVARTG